MCVSRSACLQTTEARLIPVTPTTRFADNGDTRVAYETFGSADGEPLLMFMGLDFQMIWWPDAFCQQLANAGFQVARFDNRDTAAQIPDARLVTYPGMGHSLPEALWPQVVAEICSVAGLQIPT